VKIFHTEQWTEVMSLEISKSPIKGIYPDPPGGQCVVVDKVNGSFYLNVVKLPNAINIICTN
jgi:hypothetical protein